MERGSIWRMTFSYNDLEQYKKVIPKVDSISEENGWRVLKREFIEEIVLLEIEIISDCYNLGIVLNLFSDHRVILRQESKPEKIKGSIHERKQTQLLEILENVS